MSIRMKVILFGATGMVGQGVLRECLRDEGVEFVLVNKGFRQRYCDRHRRAGPRYDPRRAAGRAQKSFGES